MTTLIALWLIGTLFGALAFTARFYNDRVHLRRSDFVEAVICLVIIEAAVLCLYVGYWGLVTLARHAVFGA